METSSFIGRSICEVNTPAFLVNLELVKQNCDHMLTTCKSLGIKLRAQTKTHKTVEGAILQTGGTKRNIVVSTITEAEYFASHGFDDLLYGYPLIPHHLQRCWELTRKLANFHVMVDNKSIIEALIQKPPPPGKQWSVFLKVDCGYKRAGVWWECDDGIQLAKQITENKTMVFRGIYIHCGNSYSSKNVSEVERIRDDSITRTQNFVQRLKDNSVECLTYGIGSTPSCSHLSKIFEKVTEIHPGNYVFYDVQQMQLGSCTEEDVAARVATRVIGHYPHHNQLLVDCGFTALTKQGYGEMATGYAVFQNEPNLKLVNMTQEIGKVEPIEGQLDYSKYPINSMLFLYPYHSCATAAMHPIYYVHVGDTIVEEWKPVRGW